MTISDERNIGMQGIRNEYMRIKERMNRDLVRRITQGFSHVQALTGLVRDISGGNFDSICSPPQPGSFVARRPSMIALGRALVDLNAATVRARISAAAPTSRASSSTLSSRASELNLGNTVRNLEPELSAPRPTNELTAENRVSLRTLNRIRNLRHRVESHSRNTHQRERTPTPRKSANKRGRITTRRNANVRERSPLPRGIVRDPERTPSPREIVEDPKTSPLPRGIVRDPERTPPPREIVEDPKTSSLPIGIVRDPERTPPPRRIVNYSERTLPLTGIADVPERRPPPRRTDNDPERSPPPRRAANDPERTSSHFQLLPDVNIPQYQYNPDTFNPSDLTLEQAVTVMNYFNTNNDREYGLIRTSILKFSIKIYGLENCAMENLVPAVLLFIDKYFNIQPMIELCMRPVRDHQAKNVVGVLFHRCATANEILERRNILIDTRYWVAENDMCDWIIFNYEHS